MKMILNLNNPIYCSKAFKAKEFLGTAKVNLRKVTKKQIRDAVYGFNLTEFNLYYVLLCGFATDFKFDFSKFRKDNATKKWISKEIIVECCWTMLKEFKQYATNY